MAISRLYAYTDDVDTANGAEVAAEFDNIYDNIPDPDNLDDASANTAAMQATRDPYPAASESLATTLRHEMQSLRYLIKQITGEAQWYIDPDSDIAALFNGKLNVVAKTTTYIATAADCIITGDASGGAFTITLPTAVGVTGKLYYIKKIDTSTNAVTVDGDGTETIDAVLSLYLRSYHDWVMVCSDGANWVTLGQSTPARIPQHRGLTVFVNASNPAYQLDIDADAFDVELNNHVHRLHSVNLTVDITASGANGLDTGAEASGTTYASWVIYNPTTNTTAGLLSTSFTAPTMPSGYTYKRLVSFVRNDGSSNFIPFYQDDNRLIYDDPLDDTGVLTDGGANSFTDVDCTNFAGNSAITRQAILGWTLEELTDDYTSYGYIRRNGATGNGRRVGPVIKLTSGTSDPVSRADFNASTFGQYNSGELCIPLDSSLIFEYKVGADVTADMDIWVHGLILKL